MLTLNKALDAGQRHTESFTCLNEWDTSCRAKMEKKKKNITCTGTVRSHLNSVCFFARSSSPAWFQTHCLWIFPMPVTKLLQPLYACIHSISVSSSNCLPLSLPLPFSQGNWVLHVIAPWENQIGTWLFLWVSCAFCPREWFKAFVMFYTDM